MKALILSLFTFFSLVIISCTQGPEAKLDVPDTSQEDIAAINQFHTSWVDAVKQLDIDAEMALWDENGIAMAPNSESFIGKEKVRERIQFYNETEVSNVNVTIKEIKVDNGWAFIRQTFKAMWIPKDGSAGNEENGKEIMILKRQPDNSWRIFRYIWNTNLPLESS